MALPVLAAATEALGGLGTAIKALGAATVGPTAAITGLGAALNLMVAKANPVVAEQFTLALNDLMAVIGQGLVPLMNTVFIPVVRMAADALMQLQPAGMALAAALQPLVPIIGEVFALAIGVLAEAVKAAAPFLMVFARVVADVVRFVADGVKELLSLIGINIDTPKAGASVGAAVRQSGHSSVDDVVKQAQKAAFSLGTASEDPMKKMAGITEQIKAQADKIYDFLQQLPQLIWDFVQKLPSMIWDFVKQLPDLMWQLMTSAGKSIGNALTAPIDTSGTWAGRNVIDPIAGLADRANRFGDSVKDQFNKPGIAGFTTLNPF